MFALCGDAPLDPTTLLLCRTPQLLSNVSFLLLPDLLVYKCYHCTSCCGTFHGTISFVRPRQPGCLLLVTIFWFHRRVESLFFFSVCFCFVFTPNTSFRLCGKLSGLHSAFNIAFRFCGAHNEKGCMCYNSFGVQAALRTSYTRL